MVRADNFIRRIGGASAVITNGERIENIKLELTALGTISGGAFDENGEPVVGARVEALAGLMNSPLLVLDRMWRSRRRLSLRTTREPFGFPVLTRMSIMSASFPKTIERMGKPIPPHITQPQRIRSMQ